MSNSPLATYTNLSPYRTSPRNAKIDTITIHCVAGQWTHTSIANYFANTANLNASCNYGVGKDGSICLVVDEGNRSWCSSSSSNDHRAITIEVASDTTSPYAVTDAALNGLIALCADICERNGIEKLLWEGNSSLIGNTARQNMTVHRWFANKACPGDYLYNKHGYIAEEVNKILEGNKEDELDMTRDEVVVLIKETVAAINAETATATAAKDVSSWATESWNKATEKKVFDGSAPGNSITREQTAVVLDRLGLLDSAAE